MFQVEKNITQTLMPNFHWILGKPIVVMLHNIVKFCTIAPNFIISVSQHFDATASIKFNINTKLKLFSAKTI